MFIHITAGFDHPHRVTMALHMAFIMSEDKDLILYFDIEGIEVVLKDSPDISYAQFAGSKTQPAALTEKGIAIEACPGCLKAAGKTEADLAEGICVADKDGFYNFTRGRILTPDYRRSSFGIPRFPRDV